VVAELEAYGRWASRGGGAYVSAAAELTSPSVAVVKASPVARPLLKWCGGKGKLLPALRPLFPRAFRRYFEPFVGGGAVFFDLKPERAWLNDANAHLINTYWMVRDCPEELIESLGRMRYEEQEYHARLEWFNTGMGTEVMRAATFIYLNKTCFNGLWRVNQKGECNVSFGKYDNPTICDAENIRACSMALRGVPLWCGDFAQVENVAGPGDFVFFDSPHVPRDKTARFVEYTKDGFGPKDHVRLAELCKRLARRGVHWAMSNADVPLVRELYAGFPVHQVSRSGSVSSNPSKRQRVAEVLVSSGTWEVGG
jgi:DNA adenine methylase